MNKLKFNISKRELYNLYWNKKLTLRQIGKKSKCSQTAIKQRFKKYCIKIRTNTEIMKERLKNPENHPHYIDSRTSKKYYCIEPGCNNEICYANWLHGNRRCYSCASKGKLNNMFGIHKFGKEAFNFIHGKSNEPYPLEFNESLKEIIRDRDNHTCQKCGCPEVECIRKLDVHHIDYNKENSDKNNLISLCSKCNLKVNKNRDYWYAYFTYIIKEKLK